MGEIRCGKRRILSAFALHKNSAFEIHTTICQYSMDGDLIAKYPTLAEAIRSSRIMSIRKCLIGERKQAGGYKWSYDDHVLELCKDS